MPKRTDPEVEGIILGLSKTGLSQRSIVGQLRSDGVVVSRRTVHNVINRIGKNRQAKAKGQPLPVKFQPSPSATPHVIRKINAMSQLENPPSQREMSKKVGVSLATVNRILKKLGKRVARKTKVHKLLPRHMQNRKTNCRKLYERLLAGQRWEYMVTLDEALFGLHCVNGKRKICYVNKGDQVPEDWVVDKDNFFKTFMVVGAISGRGTLPLIRIPKKVKVNAAYYISNVLDPIIHRHLPRLYEGEMEKVTIHHDQATSHTAGETVAYAAEIKSTTGVTIMAKSDIPVKSPDASPLDFFGFGYLKRRLSRRKARTEPGLWKVMNQEWNKIDNTLVTKVFNCWKQRLRLVVKGDGRHIENTKNIHSRRR
jgi:hypothetical protein